MMHQLQWDTLSTRRLLSQLSMFHKIHHHLVSIPFPPEVQLITSSSTRHCHPFCYFQLQPRIQVYQYAFYPIIIPVWNRLPEQVVTIPTTKGFQVAALPVIQSLQPPVGQSIM